MGEHDTSPTVDLVDLFIDYLRIKGRSQNTRDTRRGVLLHADRELPYGLDQAEPGELQRWLYRDEWSASTKADYFQALHQFYVWADGRHLSFNPMADDDEFPHPARKAGRPRPITNEQLERILTHAHEPVDLWALIAAYEGARCIEISNLDREHIDAEHTWLLGKGGKERLVPTDQLVWAVVRDLPGGPVARNRAGRRLGPKYISNVANLHFRTELAMPGVTMHRVRHWFGTHAQRGGSRDIRVTQEMLGHASPETTALYTAVAYEDMRAAVDALPRIIPRRLAGRDRPGAASGEAAAA
jgi:integrase